MAILGRDEFFSKLHDRFAEDTSDDAISFIEDMTDTYNDMENRASGDGTDWEAKYKELDESWKKRYRHRFFSGGDKDIPASERIDTDEEVYNPDQISVADLFKKTEE